jgi:hypothetical protein
LVNFVDRMTRINRGRVFYSSADNLGEYVRVDYVNQRRRRVTSEAGLPGKTSPSPSFPLPMGEGTRVRAPQEVWMTLPRPEKLW